MRIERLYTRAGEDIYATVAFRTVTDEQLCEFIVPQAWSPAAVEVLVQEIFCRKPLPSMVIRREERGVPRWLCAAEREEGETLTSFESDIREVLHRLSGYWTYQSWKAGVFASENDARAFYDEMRYMLLHGLAVPEIALWKNIGLSWAYGLEETSTPLLRQSLGRFNAEALSEATSQLVSVQEEKNIFRRIQLEAATRALKKASLRTALTSAARYAVVFPVEHDESPAFISWKRNRDLERAATETGTRVFARAFDHIMEACDRTSVFGFDPARNGRLASAVETAIEAGVPAGAAQMAIDYARQGFEDIRLNRPSLDDEDESGASLVTAVLSVPDSFIESALTSHGFLLHEGGEARRHVAAAKLWDSLAESVWVSGEPAVFFKDSAEAACAFIKGALLPSASGGLVFAPESVAPAATLNLQRFMTGVQEAKTYVVETEKLAHAARLMTTALDASCPVEKNEYRPIALGLSGYAGFLMGNGLAYDSDEGRTVCALVTALVTGAAAQASAEMAATGGSFPAYRAHEKEFIAHVRDKRDAITGTAALSHGMTRKSADVRPALCPDKKLLRMVEKLWGDVYSIGKDTGWRNAHWTAVDTEDSAHALLGTSAKDLLPESMLVCLDENFGKTLHPLAAAALDKLGFTSAQKNDIFFYVCGNGTLLDAPGVNHASLKKKGFHQAALTAVETALKTAQDIRYAFNRWTLGEDFCVHMLGFEREALDAPDFDMLSALGYSADDIDDANIYCCGAGSLQGAPHVHPEHLAVFDGQTGAVRRVSAAAQVRLQAAVETFLSGGAVLPLEIEATSSVDDIQRLFLTAWELGVKNLKIYRRNSALDIAAVRPLERPVEESQAATDGAYQNDTRRMA